MNVRTYFQTLRQKRRLKKSGLVFPLKTKLHGLKNSERQGGLTQSKALDELQLVHTPLPDYPHNVYVYSIPLNRVLGYLDEEISLTLLSVFGQNFCLDGEIHKITGGAPLKYFGCEILVFDTTDFLADCEDFSHLHE